MKTVIPPSLLKYETPILVSSSYRPHTSSSAKGKRKPTSTQPESKTDDFLNQILPPMQITENGQMWVRYVSATPATTYDVQNLTKDLDKHIRQKQAHDNGICLIREEIYGQCFDEIIRQIAIHCQDRGVLLLRVRDEYRMIRNQYESLYDSSIAYGMKKALVAAQTKADAQQKIRDLEKDCRDLNRQIDDLTERIEVTTVEAEAERKTLNENHEAAKEEFRGDIIKLKLELDKVISLMVKF